MWVDVWKRPGSGEEAASGLPYGAVRTSQLAPCACLLLLGACCVEKQMSRQSSAEAPRALALRIRREGRKSRWAGEDIVMKMGSWGGVQQPTRAPATRSFHFLHAQIRRHDAENRPGDFAVPSPSFHSPSPCSFHHTPAWPSSSPCTPETLLSVCTLASPQHATIHLE